MNNTMIGTLGILGSLLIGALIAYVGSSHSVSYAGVPVFAICGAFAFIVQWVVFTHAWIKHTEHFFDLTGSLTYLTMITIGVVLGGTMDVRSLVIVALIAIWAIRLGSFLFLRVRGAGEDSRFRKLKFSFPMFLMTWTLQGTWVFITAACALAAITSNNKVAVDVYFWVGLALWCVGFVIEVVSDRQKTAFRADPANAERFITSGLWAWSRHPNYFGEIVLWAGIAVMALPTLQGLQYGTLISPVFVVVLLTYISGVRMLENKAEKTWGADADYQAYKARTPVLLMLPPGDRGLQSEG
ncbi:MAG: DUF1295 domain-containing protein [Pseudomonadota bacterium]